MKSIWMRVLPVMLGVLSALVGTAALADSSSEQLHYRASYRGFFSAGVDMSIADITLSTRLPRAQAPYLETEMGVTSAAYAHVEAFYPIRYRFRSWYLRDRSASLVSEYFERNNPDKLKHRLIYLDDPGEDFVAHDLLQEGQLDLPALLTGDYRPPSTEQAPPARFDRLGLLQHVRGLPLAVGMMVDAPVTNGRAMLQYRIKVEARETIEVAGEQWQALKLRFDALKQDEHGNEQHSHRPVYIWLSDDEQHLPLRAVSRQTLGRFRIELLPAQSPAPATHLVSTDE